MPMSVLLYLLTFCGYSSSLISFDWVRNGSTGTDDELLGMVPKGRYPFMAFIIGDDALGCSGTIVSWNFTLTAATCVIGLKSMRVWAGTNRLLKWEDFQPPTQHRAVVEVVVYNVADIKRHDIAVLMVDRPWDLSEYVSPIQFWVQMPLLKFEFLEEMVVLGWGCGNMNVTDKVLRGFTATIGSSVMCPLTFLQLERTIMCSNEGMNQAVCKGDIGGAVVGLFEPMGFMQLGVIKGHVPSDYPLLTPPPERALDPTCYLPNVAIMYTYVGFYRDWLMEKVNDTNQVLAFWPHSMNKKFNQTSEQKPDLRREASIGSTGPMAQMSQHLLLAALCLLLLPTMQHGSQ